MGLEGSSFGYYPDHRDVVGHPLAKSMQRPIESRYELLVGDKAFTLPAVYAT